MTDLSPAAQRAVTTTYQPDGEPRGRYADSWLEAKKAPTHDELCPVDETRYVEGVPFNICVCRRLTLARADERARIVEEIAQRRDWSER